MADVEVSFQAFEVESTTKGDEFIALSMNLKNLAVTQISNYNFNSLVEWQGKVYGASVDGLFSLEDSQRDNGADIPSFFEFWIGDIGVLNVKRIRAIHLGGEFNGNMSVTVTDDDGSSITYPITVEKTGTVGVAGYTQHGVRVFVERTHQGRYWKLRVENDSGADFSIDEIHVSWLVMAGSKQRER